MRIIALPKPDTSTGGITTPIESSKWEFVISEQLKPKENNELVWDVIQKITTNINDLDKRARDSKAGLEKYENELRSQNSRHIEIVGMFSAFVALVISNVQLGASQSGDLSKTIPFLVVLDVFLVLFMSLIHYFFNAKKETFPWGFWFGFVAFPLTIMLAVIVLQFCKS